MGKTRLDFFGQVVYDTGVEKVGTCILLGDKIPDKFPEAFKRFERQISLKNIEAFRQLTLAFGTWAGRKWVPTYRQMDALTVQAKELGIPTKGYRSREEQVLGIFQTARETRVAGIYSLLCSS
jgi:hypothetical protein